MDIPRDTRGARWKRWTLMVAGGLLFLMSTVALARMEPAAPSVDRGLIWSDTVRRGSMVRQVRGPGTLVPEQIRYVSGVTAGRVERLLVEPGAEVTPETVLLVLSNPNVHLQAMESQRQLATGRSTAATLRASLENQRLTQEAAVASVRSQLREAHRQAEVNRTLADRGLIARLDRERTDDIAAELDVRLNIEERRLDFLGASMEAQLAAQGLELERLETLAELRQSDVASLAVTAGVEGVLREMSLQEGEWVGPGHRLAIIVRPGRLKAELRIPETQAKDLAIGQSASIDTRNGIVPGRVSRIDPAVQNGTVTVDVALEGELPRGARPDLSVDGTIELERLDDVLYLGRPAHAQQGNAIGLFRIAGDGKHADRASVQIGRISVNTVEILAGLQEGDVVILSDLGQWMDAGRVRLK